VGVPGFSQVKDGLEEAALAAGSLEEGSKPFVRIKLSESVRIGGGK
jgi:hypothetical protein